MSKEHSNKARASYGTWKCQECSLIFETRAKLREHNRSNHQNRAGGWNKGLTKETSISIANASKKVSEGVEVPSSLPASLKKFLQMTLALLFW